MLPLPSKPERGVRPPSRFSHFSILVSGEHCYAAIVRFPALATLCIFRGASVVSREGELALTGGKTSRDKRSERQKPKGQKLGWIGGDAMILSLPIPFSKTGFTSSRADFYDGDIHFHDYGSDARKL